ncbi:hypothetical protein QBC46DRAFT_90710 [Diplogelasinospora grovesii]|uniref:ABM domain-containing protein n=1 Tax=Diplogelasinospora grovesii TaxID=303347 RepID=A0AAN6RYN3_9PEZI|nr:hypothetical protein QBC46DRAFT_90710 [Diplogelasinospora grovesii]
MPEVTEIAWMPLKADAKDHEATAALKALGPEMLAQPGLLSSWHGLPIEKPSSVEVVNVWDSEASYTTSQSSPLHAKSKDLIKQVIDTSDPAVHPYHNTILFDKPFDKVASAPVVQMTAIFLPAATDKAEFETAFEGVLDLLRGNMPAGFVIGTHGWATNEIEHHPKIGGKAKVFVSASGWESLEKITAAHAGAGGAGGIADKFKDLERFGGVHDAHHTMFKKAGTE